MNYSVLDVETANPDYSSICQIGLVVVRDGAVTNARAWLVNPECFFDPFNMQIHGIDEQMVAGAGLFPAVYTDILALCGQDIVVHHGSFDRIALTRAKARYEIASPDMRFLDSQAVVRRVWPDVSLKGYALKKLADRIGFVFQHHDALQDALATQAVLAAALQDSGQTVEWWCDRVKRPIDTSGQKITGSGDPAGPFYGKTVVFTGTLSVERKRAAELAKVAGFDVAQSVTGKTDILCVGITDQARMSAGYIKSSKQRQAEKLISQGNELRIIFEDDFRDMCRSGFGAL